ncbi:DUF6351 family protein [Duganella sp. S19_KUP01_CR8]|uniref:DUF6351 family protein n=1 Tax=Duganella sp. S19_KUP01_CR8 TaxID=3025502 RepID=UPI002FCDB351
MAFWRFLAACAATAICLAAQAQQQPFVCRTQEAGLGQPSVDNQDGIGHPVVDENSGAIVGYSRNCGIATRVQYFYLAGSRFKPFDPATGYTAPPPDLTTIQRNGAAVPFVVRVEVGTINRFVYTIAMLAPAARPEPAAWNRKLVYWLGGGVGIGHHQGLPLWFKPGGLSGNERQLMVPMLEQGYAIVSSTGNEAGVHYNMRLAGQTAMLTKARFVEAYGAPLFTIGLGGSGGAVQQYLFAQNHPGLLDGGIPLQSYPDMITQTIPVSDCPLLSQYFKDEVALDPASPWARWTSQIAIEGMNASDTAKHAWTGAAGSTECINGWKMAIVTVLNPRYKDDRYDLAATFYRYPAGAFDKVKWTHWNDLEDIYGTDAKGYAPISVDNEGVQYGLQALRAGRIGVDEFLRLNACVGGWKEQADFVDWQGKDDPYDSHNMLRSATCRDPDGTPSARRSGSVDAMRKAYTSGQVFTGQRLGIPMIDLRPYLEPELNMHNARQAFSVRARLQAGNARDAQNQVIWFTRTEADMPARVLEALSVMDKRLSGGAPPAEFTDRCIDTGGAVIASGPAAWDGILDRKPPGACTRAFPLYSSPRMVAGESLKGDIFKCALKPVAQALRDGGYPAGVAWTVRQQARLQRIFPRGVCDYSQPDQGRPPVLERNR